jgi:glyoxylate/hydroxypyruvate reductase
MPSNGSISQAISTTQTRLTSISSHLRANKPKVVVTRSLGPDVMPLLTERDDIDVVLWPEEHAQCDRQWLLENVRGATGIVIVFSEQVNAELLDAAGPNLKVVSTMSVGYEHIQVSELAKRNIRMGYTPEVLTDAVADVAVMLALMAGRNANETMGIVREGQWPKFIWAPFALCGPQLSTTHKSPSRTVGFLGFGRISQAILARLIPFGVTDCIYSANPSSSKSKKDRDEALLQRHQLKSLRNVNVDTLARESDVLFVMTPGGSSTKHLVNEEFLRKMTKHSVLVNASRGTVVDSDALAKALREKWIWGAGVDVVEGEPNIGKDHPLVKEPRCNILPHIGSASFETRIAMATLAVDNCLAGIAGQNMPAELDVKTL